MSPTTPCEGRILIVDDDPGARLTTAALLDDMFEVVTATSGAAALQILDGREIDVVCTDYEMPGMSGTDLLRRVFGRFPCVAGVLVTGHREFLAASSSLGRERVFDILIKPLDGEHVLRTITRAVGRSRVARELQRRGSS